jgi:hypothetical protein
MKSIRRMLLSALAMAAMVMPTMAHAGVPTFVGSYLVDGGGLAPSWTTNPVCYTPQEAAALLFGGAPTDYFISVDPSMDPTTITHTGHEDGWAEPDTIFAENFKLQTGTGYNDPGGFGSAWSAYVFDHSDANTNYVWAANGDMIGGCGVVPEPGSISLLSMGLVPLFGIIRRRLV